MDLNTPVNATVRQWQLTEALREFRERSGLTMDQAVERLQEIGGGKWSKSKMSRIEKREQGIKSAELAKMLDVYGVTDSNVRGWMLDLATRPPERGYWFAIRRDLPEDFHGLLNVEAALIARRQLETIVVPGLLQTPEYTRAMIIGANPGMAHDVVERRVVARASRQRVLTGPDPLRYHVILNESILEQPIGSEETMAGQFARLLAAAKADNITIQVLPVSAGASPMVDGPFSLLTLPEPIPDFGYTEGQGGAIYIEDRAMVRTCTERWGILTECAQSPADSMQLIKEAGKTYA